MEEIRRLLAPVLNAAFRGVTPRAGDDPAGQAGEPTHWRGAFLFTLHDPALIRLAAAKTMERPTAS